MPTPIPDTKTDTKEQILKEEYSKSLPLLTQFNEYLLILNPNFKLPPSEREWLVELDRMLRIDKRTPEEIERVIIWLRTSQFWSKNVLSIPKLRKQFDRLILEMGNSSIKIKEEKAQGKEDNRQLLTELANLLCSNTNDPLVANGIKLEEHYFQDRSKGLTVKYSLSKAEILDLISQKYDFQRPYIADFLSSVELK